MSFILKKVERRSAETEAAAVLRDAITSGSVALGSRLTEVNLATQLGVSRTTVRSVLNQLVQEGLVVQVPYVGWSVMTLSVKDVWELYTLRSSLETLAARIVSNLVAAADRQVDIETTLTAGLDKLEQACRKNDPARIAYKDMALHRSIIDASGHSRLSKLYDQIQHQTLIYIRSSDDLVSHPKHIVDQHRPVIEAILAGDETRAANTIADHIESEGAVLSAFVSDCAAVE